MVYQVRPGRAKRGWGERGGGSDSYVPIPVYLSSSSQHSDQQRPMRPALRPAKTEEAVIHRQNNLINVKEAGYHASAKQLVYSATCVLRNLCTPQLVYSATCVLRNLCTPQPVCSATCVFRNLRLRQLCETGVTKTESEKPAAGTSSKRQSNFLREPSPLPPSPPPPPPPSYPLPLRPLLHSWGAVAGNRNRDPFMASVPCLGRIVFLSVSAARISIFLLCFFNLPV